MESFNTHIDKGWAWFVMLAAFGVQFITSTSKCIGVLIDELQERFQCSMWTLTAMQSTSMALWLGLAPISNALAVRFTARKVVFTGALFGVIGFMGSSFVHTPGALFFFQGVVGVGYGLSFAPCLVEISHYFRKFQGAAMSLCQCGSALGHIIMPMIIRNLVDVFGIRGFFVIMSSFMANICVFAMLLRPVSFYKVHSKAVSLLFAKDNLIGCKHSDSYCPRHDEECQGEIIINLDTYSKAVKDEELYEADNKHRYSNKKNLNYQNSTETVRTNSQSNYINGENLKSFGFLCNKKYFKWSLFRNSLFVVILISACCAESIWSTGFMILPSIAYHENFFQSSNYAVSFVGGADIISRFMIGPCTDIVRIPRKYIFIASVILTGVTMFLAPLVSSTAGFIVICIMNGVFAPFTLVLSLLVLSDELGIDSLSSAFGFLYFATALGVSSFGQIAGALYDATNRWNASCWFLASTGIISGISFVIQQSIKNLSKH